MLALPLPSGADPLAWPDESAQRASRDAREQLTQIAMAVQGGASLAEALAPAFERLESLSRGNRGVVLQQIEWLLLALRPAARTELAGAVPERWKAFVQLYGDGGADIAAGAARDWLERSGTHPARDFVQRKSRTARDSDIRRIALALPQAEPYAEVSQAITSGLVSAYYSDAAPRPEILFLDSDGKTAEALLREAQDADADVLIGPLLGERVQAAVRAYDRGRYPFAMLALNQATPPLPRGVFTYFPSAESEASQIAARLQHLGVQAPLVMLADDDWAKRQLARLQQVWSDLIASESIQDNPELTAIVARALGTAQSGARHRAIERASVLQLEFEPRRRTDMDALVLLAPAPIARRIHPALAFNFAQDITLLAGRRALESEKRDADLYNLRSIALPLLLSPPPDQPWEQPPQNSVFVAMGMDALRLARRLAPGHRLYGASGFLRVGDDGRVIHQPTWGHYTQQGLVAGEPLHYYPLFREHRQADGAEGETPP